MLSDWNAVTELQEHGIAAGRAPRRPVKALTAGVDMEMTSDLYLTTLEQSVREKRLPAALVDRAVRAVLRVKFRLGLFDPSFPQPPRTGPDAADARSPPYGPSAGGGEHGAAEK